ncbi:hypothetical protein ABEV34_06425 [Methylorubrum rhodesianum]|jgi:hypothetical protein|uniref:hypothetical protein n=1 Tax=Methylorubrum TaxID=2282523 RepID=UPI0003498514|nr:hypothetical protein [Methylorubrum rhodesianum]MBB5765807.1 hypothetical protein [Methylorubrum rhodesianum]
MTTLDTVGIPSGAFDRVAAVWDATEVTLWALVAAGGLDPASDFRHRDLRGWPLGGEDVRGFDFTGSDLRSTGFEAAVVDATTILDGATLDPAVGRKPARAAPAPAARGRAPRAVPPEGGYTKVRVPDLSDAELVDRTFVIADPLALENLTQGAPPADQWLTYEGRYEVGAMVACAFAHRHKRGYIFRDEADRRYLIGHECGAKHFGLGNWQSFTAGRERLEERGSYLRVIRDLADTLRAHRDWIAGLPKNPAVRAFDALRVDLRTLFPGLVSAIKSVISRHDGVLTVTVEARDYAAEERRREREQEARAWYTGLGERERAQFHTKGGRAPTVDKSPLRKREARALGTLRGSVLFSNSPALGQAMREVLPLVDAFLAMPRTPTTRRDLLGVTRNARELVTRVLRVRDSLLDAVEFFDRDNLERVARWADALRIDGLHYVANAGRVDAELIEGGQRRSLVYPPELQPMADEPFDRVGSAVNTVSKRVEGSRR